MNSKLRKTLESILANPVPGTLEWARIEALLVALGCRAVEGPAHPSPSNGRGARPASTGRIPTLAVNRPLIKGFSVIGVRAGEYGRHFPEQGREHHAAVQRLLGDGVLRPAIGARFALVDARDALAAMAGRAVTGKIVVMMGDET